MGFTIALPQMCQERLCLPQGTGISMNPHHLSRARIMPSPCVSRFCISLQISLAGASLNPEVGWLTVMQISGRPGA